MKRIGFLLLFTFLLLQNGLAQQLKDNGKQWEQVEKLEREGSYRAAWTLVKKIYATAVKEKEPQQQLKALIYQLKYRDRIEENATETNIREIDSLVSVSEGTSKAILQSMLAEMYLGYVQANRFRLYNRLTSVGEEEDDLTTWGLLHLYNRIESLYKSSLSPIDTLKKVGLKTLSLIVDTGEHALELQPTLYDLLAHRALDFFTGEEQGVIHPAEHFVIDQASAFDPAESFARRKFPAGDTASLANYALKLYQQLIHFHLNDPDPAALIDVDLQRLQFVYRKAVTPAKETWYPTALNHLIRQYGKNTRMVSAVLYQLAQWHVQRGDQYDPVQHPEYRYELMKARELCLKVLKDSVETEGTIACKKLLEQIDDPSFSLKIEKVNVPQSSFRVLVSYKNTNRLWFRLIKLPEAPSIVFANPNPTIQQLSLVGINREWTESFPDPEDYQNHRTEMMMFGLSPGRYALVASGDAHFSKTKSAIVSAVFYVSGISYIDNGKGDYLVLDRATGRPLAGANIRLWTTRYNPDERKTELKEAGHFKSDEKGAFQVSGKRNWNNMIPEISWNKDHLYTGEAQYVPYISSQRKLSDSVKEKTYLFTDRSIYRPGQTIYFKGITFRFNLDTHESHVVKNKEDQVYLFDANRQKVDSLTLKTNEFGSFSGSFVLPQGGLNGNMYLMEKSGKEGAYFSVEAYKRPTFYVAWDTVGQQVRLGDTVNVKGEVVAYNQAAIDGATVNYQVFRHTRVHYPFPGYRRMVIFPPQRTASIAQGTTRTNALGHFNITFPALPDKEVDSTLQPRFIYTLSADVTDLSGESHSFSYELPLGYHSMVLELKMNDKIEADKFDTLLLSSEDLAGNFVDSRVAVSVLPVIPPKRFIRERYWEQPDQYLMDKDEYLSYFPHDEYKDESNPENWEKGMPVLVREGETQKDGKLALRHGKLQPGWYAIQASAHDKYEQLVKTVQYVQVYEKKGTLPFFSPLWLSTTELEAQPDDQVSWQIGSQGTSYLSMQDESISEAGEIRNMQIDDQKKQVDFKVTDQDRGGVIRHYMTVRYNRVFTEAVKIKVPWKNKKLHITYETFRDKLLPGAKEEWRVKIAGLQGEKVSAELLASMYDASLDAFRPHQWPEMNLYPMLSGQMNWQRNRGFEDISSRVVFNPQPKEYPVYTKAYPSLKWFGYHHGGIRYEVRYNQDMMIRGVSRKAEGNQSEEVSNAAPDTTSGRTAQTSPQAVTVRKNFDETAFFLPQLHTDDSGNVVFSFTMPEALTKWKLMMLAHTPEMKFAFSQKEVITQKPLMIQAHAPRFVRQGDQLKFTAKISNLTQERLGGKATLQLMDAITGQPVNDLFSHKNTSTTFAVAAGQSTVVKWDISVPEDYTRMLSYQLTATAGDHSDGEQNTLPVLTNRVLVTETFPLTVRGNGTHQWKWPLLQNLKQTGTLLPYGLTAEFTPNPIWYAVLALPSLDETERESADAAYSRFYANALGCFVSERIPHFEEIMHQWLTKDTTALKSPLEKDENLKSVVLQETPWVQNAQNETNQSKGLAEWFDQDKIKASLRGAIRQLEDFQLSNGGFSWFKDMPDDRYITQRILIGLGHLKQLKAWPEDEQASLNKLVQKAVPYLDARMKEDYNQIKAKDTSYISPVDFQYLYLRSFFPEISQADSVKKAYAYYLANAEKGWVDQPLYLQGMLALTLSRSGKKALAEKMLHAFTEKAIRDSVKGMHWKNGGNSWYQAPIETQALVIEVFEEISPQLDLIDDMRLWLLSQKRTQHWETTPATTDAIYALLLTGSEWTTTEPQVSLQIGDKTIDFSNNVEAGTQFKQVFIPGKEVDPGMGNIAVTVKQAATRQPGWGALYFQYFEDMDKLENSGSELKITRQISLQKNTPNGPKLIPITQQDQLKVGDKVQVRLVVKSERELDYVHLKDVRASCMEPLQVLSGFHFQDGTGYYSTVTDAAIHYYFPHLQKGTYVFTYPVFITHAGDYQGGMSTLECLYAPAFKAHSKGSEIKVGE